MFFNMIYIQIYCMEYSVLNLFCCYYRKIVINSEERKTRSSFALCKNLNIQKLYTLLTNHIYNIYPFISIYALYMYILLPYMNACVCVYVYKQFHFII